MQNTVAKNELNYRTILLDEFAARREKNTSYSLRAFARDLEVSTTCLSDVLSGKRHLSKKNALKVSDKLHLPPSQTNFLLNQLGFRSSKEHEKAEFEVLDEDTFSLVSHWYYFAIISLCKIGIKDDPKIIGKRLGISEFEARGAVGRLKRLKLVATRAGMLKHTTKTLSTSRDIPSSAIRKYHKQNLEIASQKLEDTAISQRDFSSITFPADLSKLDEAKELILEFKRRVARLMETDNATEAYTFALQLFPVSKEPE